MFALYGLPNVSGAADTKSEVEEVIVTASRRAEGVQKVPYSIAAVDGKAIEERNIQDVSGLAGSVPGMTYADKGPFGGVSSSTLIIRGLSAERTGQLQLATPVPASVATYVNETPLFVYLRLKDIERVEVLRGPQGTLYGAGSLGGTVRYIQRDPDPAGFQASMTTGLSSTAHADGLNYSADGILNVPVTERFALRFNAGYSREAGYIDMPAVFQLDANGDPVLQDPSDVLGSPAVTRSIEGANEYEYRTGRAAALWSLTDSLKVRLSHVVQESTAEGIPATSPLTYGSESLKLANSYPGPLDDDVDVSALDIEADVGFATITSSSSYFDHDNTTTFDQTSAYTSFSFYEAYYGGSPRPLVLGDYGLKDRGFVQELRLASKGGGRIDWVVGAFYQDQEMAIRQQDFYRGYHDYFTACEPVFGFGSPECGFGTLFGFVDEIKGIPVAKDLAYIADVDTSFTDKALFGELTWHITDAWQVTVGARTFEQETDQNQRSGLMFVGGDFVANQTASAKNSDTLGKINTSYQFSDAALLYATWSQGFRRGGVNALPVATPQGGPVNPALFTVEPDTADNAEIGVKGILAGRYTYGASVYNIDWKDIQQIMLFTPLLFQGVGNVGDGYSRGVELEFAGRLAGNFFGELAYSYNETELESLDPITAADASSISTPLVGARFPGSPEHSGSWRFSYRQAAGPSLELEYAVSGRTRSSIRSSMNSGAIDIGGFTMWDASVGARFGNWRSLLYVENLTDEIGINSQGRVEQQGLAANALVSRPRTVGLTLTYEFGR